MMRLLPNLNMLVAVSKGTQAVKLCFNKILHFLTVRGGGCHLTLVDLYNGRETVVVVVCF